MWSVIDDACVHVAEKFYQLLCPNDDDRFQHELVAKALNRAVIGLRDAEPHMPMKWAGFIHFGP